MKTMADISNGNGNILATIGVVFLYVLNVITVQQWAAIATIFAGLTTGGFTLYKWYLTFKKNKKS